MLTQETNRVVIVLNHGVDKQEFIREMTTSGGAEYVPSREVELANEKESSLTTVDFVLTREEYETIQLDPRVRSVRWGSKQENSIFIKPHGFSTQQTYTKGYPNAYNWALPACAIATNPFPTTGNNAGNLANYSYPYTLQGQDIDVVIVDSGINTNHPDFKYANGVSRVANNFNWFTAAGMTGTMPANYYTDVSGHGTQVTSVCAGDLYGYANRANIYSMQIDFGDNLPNSTLPVAQSIDLIRMWHDRKPVNSLTGAKRPTIVNCSWGAILSLGTPLTVTSGIYRSATWVANVAWPSDTANNYGFVYNAGGSPQYADWPRIDDAIDSAIESAVANGVIFFVSAGNDSLKLDIPGGLDYDNRVTAVSINSGANTVLSSPVYYNRPSTPASANGVIIVGAIGSGNVEQKATYSQTGPAVDIFVPGSTITGANSGSGLATFLYPGINPGNAYYSVVRNGTSFSSPVAAGILASSMEAQPWLTPQQARDFILGTGVANRIDDTGSNTFTNFYSLQGANNRFGFNRFSSANDAGYGGDALGPLAQAGDQLIIANGSGWTSNFGNPNVITYANIPLVPPNNGCLNHANAYFTVNVLGSYYSLTMTDPGNGFKANDFSTISGALIGGTSPANDILVTVLTTVGNVPCAPIATYTYSGVSSYTGPSPTVVQMIFSGNTATGGARASANERWNWQFSADYKADGWVPTYTASNNFAYTSVTSNGSSYIAVSQNAGMLGSPNGINWLAAGFPTGITSYSWNDIKASGNRFVAVGGNSTGSISQGAVYTLQGTNQSIFLNTDTNFNTVLGAVASNGTAWLAMSTYNQPNPGTSNPIAIAVDAGNVGGIAGWKYIAQNQITINQGNTTIADPWIPSLGISGITWLPNANSWVAVSPNNFIINSTSVAYSGTAAWQVSNVFYQSSYTPFTAGTPIGSVLSYNFTDIIYANNTLLAVGSRNPQGTNGVGVVLVSSDGQQWNELATLSNAINSIAYSTIANRFVAVGNNFVATSNTGSAWTTETLFYPRNFRGVTYNSNLFVAVGNGTVQYSTSGKNTTYSIVAPSYGSNAQTNVTYVPDPTANIFYHAQVLGSYLQSNLTRPNYTFVYGNSSNSLNSTGKIIVDTGTIANISSAQMSLVANVPSVRGNLSLRIDDGLTAAGYKWNFTFSDDFAPATNTTEGFINKNISNTGNNLVKVMSDGFYGFVAAGTNGTWVQFQPGFTLASGDSTVYQGGDNLYPLWIGNPGSNGFTNTQSYVAQKQILQIGSTANNINNFNTYVSGGVAAGQQLVIDGWVAVGNRGFVYFVNRLSRWTTVTSLGSNTWPITSILPTITGTTSNLYAVGSVSTGFPGWVNISYASIGQATQLIIAGENGNIRISDFIVENQNTGGSYNTNLPTYPLALANYQAWTNSWQSNITTTSTFRDISTIQWQYGYVSTTVQGKIDSRVLLVGDNGTIWQVDRTANVSIPASWIDGGIRPNTIFFETFTNLNQSAMNNTDFYSIKQVANNFAVLGRNKTTGATECWSRTANVDGNSGTQFTLTFSTTNGLRDFTYTGQFNFTANTFTNRVANVFNTFNNPANTVAQIPSTATSYGFDRYIGCGVLGNIYNSDSTYSNIYVDRTVLNATDNLNSIAFNTQLSTRTLTGFTWANLYTYTTAAVGDNGTIVVTNTGKDSVTSYVINLPADSQGAVYSQQQVVYTPVAGGNYVAQLNNTIQSARISYQTTLTPRVLTVDTLSGDSNLAGITISQIGNAPVGSLSVAVTTGANAAPQNPVQDTLVFADPVSLDTFTYQPAFRETVAIMTDSIQAQATNWILQRWQSPPVIGSTNSPYDTLQWNKIYPGYTSQGNALTVTVYQGTNSSLVANVIIKNNGSPDIFI